MTEPLHCVGCPKKHLKTVTSYLGQEVRLEPCPGLSPALPAEVLETLRNADRVLDLCRKREHTLYMLRDIGSAIEKIRRLLEGACPIVSPALPEDIICPFCREGDFDLIGLKAHFVSGHCEIFEATKSIQQERAEGLEGKP